MELKARKQIVWTRHARMKMAFYGLSRQRVLRVLHTPRRTEDGVAPKTVAMMQPASVKAAADKSVLFRTAMGKPAFIKTATDGSVLMRKTGDGPRKEVWSQEIWVMIQDLGKERRIISAWRYPGMTKPRDREARGVMRQAYEDFIREENAGMV